MLTLAYIALSVIGCGYLVIGTVLGQLHADHAGGHEHVGAHGEAAEFAFPILSPLALATIFAAIGGFGLIAKYGLGVGDGASILLAVPAAIATGYAVTYAGWKLMVGSRGSTAIRSKDLAGAAGEVITPIPADGVGEVAAMVGEERFTAPARSESGAGLARGAAVSVVRMSAGTLIVRPSKQ